jgi:hypothetical protein
MLFLPSQVRPNEEMTMYLKTAAIGAMGLFCLSTASHAALAPNYQRAKELTAIIAAVAEQVPAHPITKVIYQKRNQYQVIAGPCSIRALIVTEPQQKQMVGGRQFDVKLFPQRCGK